MARKDLPSPSAPNFMQRVREEIHALLGKAGARHEQALTVGDAVGAGVIGVGAGGVLVPGAGVVYTPDLTPPPTPHAFALMGLITHYLVEQAPVFYAQGHGHLRTHVYAAVHAAGAPLPTFNDAVAVGQFDGTVFAVASEPATTWRVWIKWESVDGGLSANPAGGTNGEVVTTGADVAKLVEAMTGPGNPFAVLAVDTTTDGVLFPAGTYSTKAFILDAQVSNAKIKDLAVDDAKVASLSVSKLVAGSLAVGQYAQSTGYAAGESGWRINGDGTAEFSGVTVRGTVYATNGAFRGQLLGGSATDYASGLGLFSGWSGAEVDASYRWRVGNPNGARIQWNGSAIEVYGPSNVLALSSGGVAASMVSGLGSFATKDSLDYSEVSGTKPPADADKTGANIAAGIAGQGAFATLDSITAANAGTYIANAAIGNAHIATIDAGKIATGLLVADRIESGSIGKPFAFSYAYEDTWGGNFSGGLSVPPGSVNYLSTWIGPRNTSPGLLLGTAGAKFRFNISPVSSRVGILLVITEYTDYGGGGYASQVVNAYDDSFIDSGAVTNDTATCIIGFGVQLSAYTKSVKIELYTINSNTNYYCQAKNIHISAAVLQK